MRADFVVGLRFIFGQGVLRSLTLVMTIGMTSGGIIRGVLFTFAYRRLGLSSSELGFLLALGGVASLLGAFACRPLSSRIGPGRVLLWAPVADGLFWLLAPLAMVGAALPLLGLAIIGSSLIEPLWNVNSLTIRQQLVPSALQGRVHAAVRTVSWLGFPIGGVLGGALAQFLTQFVGPSTALALTLVTGAVLTLHSFIYINAKKINAASQAFSAAYVRESHDFASSRR